MRAVLVTITALVMLAARLVAFAESMQDPQDRKPTGSALTSSQALLQSWSDIGRKLVALAEEFPEEKYGFRPAPAQRTFAEQLLHVAGSNDLFSDVAKGQKVVDDESPMHYRSKAAVVAYLKQSFDKGAAAIREKGETGMAQTVVDSESGRQLPLTALGWELIEHSGEHYGQLVVYYRVAGLVPPESRPRK